MPSHFTFHLSIRRSTFDIQNSTFPTHAPMQPCIFFIRHPVSVIRHPASGIRHPPPITLNRKESPMPKLALISPVHNCLEYTQAMLSSIRFFENKLNIYIIDNGSTDKTQQALMKMIDAHKFFYIRFDRNLGVAAAWNTGIRAAMSHQIDYYLITNNDVVFRDDTLINLFTQYLTDDVDLLSAYNIHDQYPLELLDSLKPVNRIGRFVDFSCFILARHVIDKIGWFDENFYPAYFEDCDYQARLWLADLHSYSTKMALYYHYGSVTQKSIPGRICQSAEYQANQKRFIAKWGHLPVPNADQAHKHYFKHPFNIPQYSLKDCPSSQTDSQF